MDTPSQPGTIITFYSYKGGTGRSMTLANVAWILASRGKRVLTIDWDLEAPGLHRYFWPFLGDKDLISSEGVIDFVFDYITEVMTPANGTCSRGSNAIEGQEQPPPSERGEQWYATQANILRYASTLEWKGFGGNGFIDFIPSGRQGPSYTSRISSISWPLFYEKLGGGELLTLARQKMRAEYDYVLIDSRTGLSDTAGICTVHLPDILVVCFTLNHQSIEGASAVAASVYSQRKESELRIFPVPMRIEMAEKEKLQARREYARSKFGIFPDHLDQSEREAYWGAVELIYDPFYAYEEVLTPFGDKPGRPGSLLAGTERLTAYLTGGTVASVQPPVDSERSTILAQYARKATAEAPQDEARAAERAFAQLGPDAQMDVRRLFPRLVRLARPDEKTASTRVVVSLTDYPAFRPLLPSLVSAGVLQIESGTPAGSEGVQLTTDGIVQQWRRLHAWLEEDRDFLLWRQQLDLNVAEWRAKGRAADCLLFGGALQTAVQWRAQRAVDLNAHEQEYIDTSAAVQDEMMRALDHQRYELEQTKRRSILGTRLAVAISLTAVLFGIGLFSLQRKTADDQLRGLASSAIFTADKLARNGQIDEALNLYSSAIHVEPDNANAYLSRGRLYVSVGKMKQAIDDLQQVLTLNNNTEATIAARVGLEALARQEPAAQEKAAVR